MTDTDTDRTSAPNWEGLPGSTEHRTVGPHRAWCHQDAVWCYPVWGKDDSTSMLCHCCDQTLVPERWKGENVSTILTDLRRRVLALEKVEQRDDVLCTVWLDEVLDLLDGNNDG